MVARPARHDHLDVIQPQREPSGDHLQRPPRAHPRRAHRRSAARRAAARRRQGVLSRIVTPSSLIDSVRFGLVRFGLSCALCHATLRNSLSSLQAQQAVYLHTGYIFSTGFSRTSERQLALWHEVSYPLPASATSSATASATFAITQFIRVREDST